MPRDWKGPFSRRLQARASERGRRLANRRWEIDRARRQKLATLTAEQFPSKIVKRIVVIDQEQTAREAVIWSFDSARSARQKIRSVLTATLCCLFIACSQRQKTAGLVRAVVQPVEVTVKFPRCRGLSCDGYGCNQAITRLIHSGDMVTVEVTTPAWATVGVERSSNLVHWSPASSWYSNEHGRIMVQFPANAQAQFFRVTTEHP